MSKRTLGLILLGIAAVVVLFYGRSLYLHAILAASHSSVILNEMCDNGYNLRIDETPKFDKGNKFELGHFSRIIYPRTLSIVSPDGQIIPHTIVESQWGTNRKILASRSFKGDTGLGSYVYFDSWVSPKLPLADFSSLASCIESKRTIIQKTLGVTRIEHSLEGRNEEASQLYFTTIDGAEMLGAIPS